MHLSKDIMPSEDPMPSILTIECPVHGVFITPNTPGSKVPSHGTSDFGEAYAIDFVFIDEGAHSKKAYRGGVFAYLFGGISLSDFYGWGQEIHSPFDGTVVGVVNSIAEREPVSLFGELRHTVQVTRDYMAGRAEPVALTGNYVMLKNRDGIFALLAHLKTGSVLVHEGEDVRAGQVIASLGHSGNSTMPHLHMQFMDSPDFLEAQGRPFAIKDYEILKAGKWQGINNAVPTKKDIIRHKQQE